MPTWPMFVATDVTIAAWTLRSALEAAVGQDETRPITCRIILGGRSPATTRTMRVVLRVTRLTWALSVGDRWVHVTEAQEQTVGGKAAPGPETSTIGMNGNQGMMRTTHHGERDPEVDAGTAAGVT